MCRGLQLPDSKHECQRSEGRSCQPGHDRQRRTFRRPHNLSHPDYRVCAPCCTSPCHCHCCYDTWFSRHKPDFLKPKSLVVSLVRRVRAREVQQLMVLICLGADMPQQSRSQSAPLAFRCCAYKIYSPVLTIPLRPHPVQILACGVVPLPPQICR